MPEISSTLNICFYHLAFAKLNNLNKFHIAFQKQTGFCVTFYPQFKCSVALMSSLTLQFLSEHLRYFQVRSHGDWKSYPCSKISLALCTGWPVTTSPGDTGVPALLSRGEEWAQQKCFSGPSIPVGRVGHLLPILGFIQLRKFWKSCSKSQTR